MRPLTRRPSPAFRHPLPFKWETVRLVLPIKNVMNLILYRFAGEGVQGGEGRTIKE